jgi:hypothetical protein
MSKDSPDDPKLIPQVNKAIISRSDQGFPDKNTIQKSDK